jgi:hypothetical protein
MSTLQSLSVALRAGIRNGMWMSGIFRLDLKKIDGMTPNARNQTTIQYRFQRFRFPFVEFEWHVVSPHHQFKALLVNKMVNQPMTVKFLWKAWAKGYAASAVIAVGSSTDTLVLCAQPNSESIVPVIRARDFVVARITQPELMKPIPYPRNRPAFRPRDLGKFATSHTIIQLLESSKKRVTFLVAVSAVAISVKPFAKASAVSFTLTIISIVTATMSMLVFVIALAFKWVEANTAKYHNQ